MDAEGLERQKRNSRHEMQDIARILDKRTTDALSSDEIGALEGILREYYETRFLEFEMSRNYRSDQFSMFRVNLARRLICKYRPRNTLVVGGGLGVLEGIVRSATSIVSLDVSVRTLLYQRDHGASWPLIAASASALPVQDNAFDMVVCLEVLEHVAQPLLVLREVQRVCRKYLVISFPTDETWSYTALGIFRNPYEDITYREALDEKVGHISVPACSHGPDLLSQIGWITLGKWGQNSLMPPEYKFLFMIWKPVTRRIGKIAGLINNIDHAIAGWPWFRDHGIGTTYLFARRP